MEHNILLNKYNKQEKKLLNLEKEVFFNKISLLILFSEVLKENSIYSYILIDQESNLISFIFKTKNELINTSRTEQNLYSLLTNNIYKLNSNFFNLYSSIIKIMFFLEDSFQYRLINSLMFPNIISIDKSETLWIKLISEAIEKPHYYTNFFKKKLEKQISNHNKFFQKKLNKI